MKEQEQREVVGWLKDKRDDSKENVDEEDHATGREYFKGRYHAYVDVIAWLYGEGYIEPENRGGDDDD